MKKSKKTARVVKVEPHLCPVCGKETTNPKFCSKECFRKNVETKGSTGTLKLSSLDNTNRCRQCGCVMPLDRYSMYCEGCELLIVDE